MGTEKLLIFPGLALSYLLTAEFQNVITTGQIVIGTLLTAATLAGIIYGVRYRTAYEVENKVAEGNRQLYEMKDAESKELAAQLLEAKDMIAKQSATVARLEQLPNLERVLQLMGDLAVKQDAAAERRLEHAMTLLRAENERHEQKVIERHKMTLEALDRIEHQLDHGR
jgi:hypothetical protein